MRENMIILESVDSTNLFLKKLAEEGTPDGTVVVAYAQTAGRGRQNHSFESRQGGLYYSMLVRSEDRTLEDIMTVTAKTGVCVCHALQEAYGLSAGIKWVNDVIYHNRKLCGILVEGAPFKNGRIPWLVIGIGINVNQASFPPGLKEIATSLRIEHQQEFSFDPLISSLTGQLDVLRDNPASGSYLEEYRQLCVTVGKEISFFRDGRNHQCRALGIDEQFGLITDEGVLRSGEVSVRALTP